MIRNIVFDMGQVMIRFDPAVFMDREGITDPADRKLIQNELFRSLEWAQMDSGVLTEETAEPLILARIPDRLKDHVRNLLYNWHLARDPVPGMEQLVKSLKNAGLRIYLLSNASKAQPHYWQKLPFSTLFDGTLISCDVGVVKPMPEIYKAFTAKFSLLPEECVFIDDAAANVAGAVACGWQGIVFHGDADQAERKLREMGLKFPGKDA